MDRWENKVAVVTGASSGIGLTIAEHLVNSGLKVVGLARRKEKLDELSKHLDGRKGTFYAFKADVTKEEDILNAFQWTAENVGIVHILVNNAGLGQCGFLMNSSTDKWKVVFDTNLLGLCIATREAIKIMRDNEINGHIIHLNSTTGHYTDNLVNLNAYPASKFGVTALTETLRQELNSIGSKIKVTSISPGYVKTEIAKAFGFSEDILKVAKSLPALLPSDISEAVLYVLGTPPHVQIHEMIIRPVGE